MKKNKLKIDESQLSEEEKQEVGYHIPWFLLIICGIIIVLMIICIIVICNIKTK